MMKTNEHGNVAASSIKEKAPTSVTPKKSHKKKEPTLPVSATSQDHKKKPTPMQPNTSSSSSLTPLPTTTTASNKSHKKKIPTPLQQQQPVEPPMTEEETDNDSCIEFVRRLCSGAALEDASRDLKRVRVSDWLMAVEATGYLIGQALENEERMMDRAILTARRKICDESLTTQGWITKSDVVEQLQREDDLLLMVTVPFRTKCSVTNHTVELSVLPQPDEELKPRTNTKIEIVCHNFETGNGGPGDDDDEFAVPDTLDHDVVIGGI